METFAVLLLVLVLWCQRSAGLEDDLGPLGGFCPPFRRRLLLLEGGAQELDFVRGCVVRQSLDPRVQLIEAGHGLCVLLLRLFEEAYVLSAHRSLLL
jgi:hypothetical protein